MSKERAIHDYMAKRFSMFSHIFQRSRVEQEIQACGGNRHSSDMMSNFAHRATLPVSHLKCAAVTFALRARLDGSSGCL